MQNGCCGFFTSAGSTRFLVRVRVFCCSFDAFVRPSVLHLFIQRVPAWRTTHIIGVYRPLGFDLSEREVKRAGLDHWNHVDLKVHDSW